MPMFLDRIDAVPVINEQFPAQLMQWLWVLVDTLNENVGDTQDAFNLLTAQNLTAAQIAAMNTAGNFGNGILIYDTTNNVYVGMQSGALVKFTTAAYP